MRNLFVLISLLAWLGAAACSDDDIDNKQDSGLTPDAGTDAALPDQKVAKPDVMPDTQPDQKKVTPDQSKAKKLTKSHSGWKKVFCFDCHDNAQAKYTHAKGKYKEPDCSPCHGFNGAPHTGHATKANSGCMNCHKSVTHAAKFKSPDDCIGCHFRP